MARGSSKYLEESLTARIARFSTRHRWYIIGAWLALVVVAGVLAFDIGDVLTTSDSIATNAESERATTLLEERLRGRRLHRSSSSCAQAWGPLTMASSRA